MKKCSTNKKENIQEYCLVKTFKTLLLNLSRKTNKIQIFVKEAEFWELMRNRTRAEYEPGLTTKQEVESCLKLRYLLRKDLLFGVFPPSSQYMKGFPVLTFESVLCSTDAYII